MNNSLNYQHYPESMLRSSDDHPNFQNTSNNNLSLSNSWMLDVSSSRDLSKKINPQSFLPDVNTSFNFNQNFKFTSFGFEDQNNPNDMSFSGNYSIHSQL